MTSATGRRPDGPGAYLYRDVQPMIVDTTHDGRLVAAFFVLIVNCPDMVSVDFEYVDNMPGDFTPLTAPAAMPEPDWNEAPTWAMWWAVEYAAGDVGLAFWFAGEPVTDYAVWVDPEDEDRKQLYGTVPLPLGCDWRLSLTKRPEASDAQHCTD